MTLINQTKKRHLTQIDLAPHQTSYSGNQMPRGTYNCIQISTKHPSPFGKYRAAPDSVPGKVCFSKINADTHESHMEKSREPPKTKMLLYQLKWAVCLQKIAQVIIENQPQQRKKNTRQMPSLTSKITQIKRACVHWGFILLLLTHMAVLPSLYSPPSL